MEKEPQQEEQKDIPGGQRFFDNLLWLFLLSLVIALVVYNAWGLIEIMNTAPAP